MAAYTAPNSVVCLGGPEELKSAALYFDRVIPLSYSPFPKFILPANWDVDERLQEAFVVISSMASEAAFHSGLDRFGDLPIQTAPVLELNPDRRFGTWRSPTYKDLSDDEALAASEALALHYTSNRPNANAMRYLAMDIEGRFFNGIPVVCPIPVAASDTDSLQDVLIVLAGAKLIDVANAPWDQIRQVRTDPSSLHRLRRLQLFLFEKFVGKDPTYIKEKLEQILYDYEQAAKSHGFQTRLEVLSTLTSSKSLVALGTAALIAAALGEPMLAGTAAATGAILEASNISLKIANRRHSFGQLRSTHDLAFLIDAKRQLEPTTT